MSGIQMALLGAGSQGYQLTTGSATFTFKSSTTYLYGFSNSPSTISFTPATFGSISPTAFGPATITAIRSTSPPNSAGNASSYQVIFSGNRSAGFFNTLTINGTLVSGTLTSAYNGTNNETTFTITLGATAATLLNVNSTILLT